MSTAGEALKKSSGIYPQVSRSENHTTQSKRMVRLLVAVGG